MPYKPREIEEKLQSKFGFERSEHAGVDHRRYSLKISGLPIISTKFSHGGKEISPKLESLISKQLRVRTEFFRGMIDCTNSREDYYRQVRNDPYPPFEPHLRKHDE